MGFSLRWFCAVPVWLASPHPTGPADLDHRVTIRCFLSKQTYLCNLIYFSIYLSKYTISEFSYNRKYIWLMLTLLFVQMSKNCCLIVGKQWTTLCSIGSLACTRFAASPGIAARRSTSLPKSQNGLMGHHFCKRQQPNYQYCNQITVNLENLNVSFQMEAVPQIRTETICNVIFLQEFLFQTHGPFSRLSKHEQTENINQIWVATPMANSRIPLSCNGLHFQIYVAL